MVQSEMLESLQADSFMLPFSLVHHHSFQLLRKYI